MAIYKGPYMTKHRVLVMLKQAGFEDPEYTFNYYQWDELGGITAQQALNDGRSDDLLMAILR